MKALSIKTLSFFQQLAGKISNIPFAVAQNIFPCFVGMFIVILIIGAFMYYHYGVVRQIDGPLPIIDVPQVNKKVLGDVLRQIDSRRDYREMIDTIEYPDPFNPANILKNETVDR